MEEKFNHHGQTWKTMRSSMKLHGEKNCQSSGMTISPDEEDDYIFYELMMNENLEC